MLIASACIKLYPRTTPDYIAALTTNGFVAGLLRQNRSEAVHITLQPWAKIEGVAARKHGPITNLTVVVMQDANAGLTFFSSVKTDRQGRFSFSQLPPGPCRLGPSSGPWHALTLVSGQTFRTNLAGGAMITGKLIQKKLEKPTQFEITYGATILLDWTAQELVLSRLERPHGRIVPSGSSLQATPQANGTFQINDVPPGLYRVFINVSKSEIRDAQKVRIALPHLTTILGELEVPASVAASNETIDLGEIPVEWHFPQPSQQFSFWSRTA